MLKTLSFIDTYYSTWTLLEKHKHKHHAVLEAYNVQYSKSALPCPLGPNEQDRQ